MLFSTKPSSMPPAGYLANENCGPGLLTFIVVMQILTILSMCLRFYSRLTSPCNPWTKPRLWWDDWVALVAMAFVLTNQYLLLWSTKLGLGKHIWNVPKGNLVLLMKLNFAIYVIYTVGLTMIRQSALLFYARIFKEPHTPKWFKRSMWMVHALSISVAVAMILAKVLICRHESDNWSPTYAGKCVESPVILLASVSSNIAVDLTISLLPIPIVWGLRMTPGRRIAYMFALICGYCAPLISIGRLVTIIQHKDDLNDLTHSNVPILFWAVAECAMTTVSVCLPAMCSLGRRVMGRDNRFTRSVRSIFGLRPDRRSITTHTVSVSKVTIYHKKSGAFAVHDEGTVSEISTRRARDPYDIEEIMSPDSAYSPNSPSYRDDQYNSFLKM